MNSLIELHLHILDAAIYSESEAASPQLASAFRKATPAMQMICTVADKILQKRTNEARKNLASILATEDGELDSSLSFLRGFYEEGYPRPIQFQNSLHHATLGFLGIQYGLQGASVTLSQGKGSDLAALRLASIWLKSGQAREVLVCSLDFPPHTGVEHFIKIAEPMLAPQFQALFEKRRPASALLLTKELSNQALGKETAFESIEALARAYLSI